MPITCSATGVRAATMPSGLPRAAFANSLSLGIPPEMSNVDCRPGKAGGSPIYNSLALIRNKTNKSRCSPISWQYHSEDDRAAERASPAGTDVNGQHHAAFTERPWTLINDFLVHLLEPGAVGQPKAGMDGFYEGRDRKTHPLLWTGTPIDLIFDTRSHLWAHAKAHAVAGSSEKFVEDFVTGWADGMNPDRFDLARCRTEALRFRPNDRWIRG